MPSSNTSWGLIAARFDGVAEIKGPHHNPAILDLLDIADGKKDGRTLQGIHDDETPWCASFVSAVLELDGIPSARSAWARSYLNWGVDLVPLGGAAVDAIAVLSRGDKSGHVAFVVGRDRAGNLLLRGGNQSDKVKVSAFDPQRVIGYRWPTKTNLPTTLGFLKLPVLKIDGVGGVSRDEA